MRAILLLLLVAAPEPTFTTPREKRGDISAWLEVYVPPRPTEQGFAEATITVYVAGPKRVEAHASLLEPGGWTISETEGFRGDNGSERWFKTFSLKQTKPQSVRLPGVEVQFRGRPQSEWEKVAWTDLKEPRVTKLIDVRIEPSTAAQWPLWTAFGATLALLVAMILWKLLRTRRPTAVPPTAAELAERELAAAAALAETNPAAAHERSADAVRRLFTHRFQLPALRRTSAEFLDALEREGALPAASLAPLRTLLERCDLVKFAGLRPSREETAETIQLARNVCALAASPVAAATTPGR
jgi:hypothetical protein